MSKLKVFNRALRILGSRRLSALTENVESRRVLDDIWDENEAIKACLEMGFWNFAMRSVQLPFTPTVTPAIGRQRAFELPQDFVRTVGVYRDEYFISPHENYLIERGYIYSDLFDIYLRYVSMDTDTGLDISTWPESFTQLVAYYLAMEASQRITESGTKRADIERKMNKHLVVARSRDAQEEPVKTLPEGRWVSSRGYGNVRRTGKYLT